MCLNKLVVGDILFVRTNTFFGSVVRWFTKSHINHVGIYLGDGLVLEALQAGVKIEHIDKYSNVYKEVYRLNATIGEIDLFVRIALGKKNRPYDWGQILTIIVKKCFPAFRGSLASSKRSICSEVIYEAAKEAGFEVPNVCQQFATPEDIRKWPVLRKIEEKN